MITSKEFNVMCFKSGKTLPELAEISGKNISNEIMSRIDLDKKNILILCGPGNNGADGLVIARHLREYANVNVIYLGRRDKIEDDIKINYLRVLGNIKNDTKLISKADILIDAMIGTGVTGLIKEPIRSAVIKFNQSKAYKVAVDIPTGLNPDNGVILDIMVYPDIIFTLYDVKPGLEKFKAKTVIVPIEI